MKLVILGLVSASLIGVGSAEAHQGRAHHNAASNSSHGYVARGYVAPAQPGAVHGSSRAQTWYSDTGWQPGTSAITSHGYGYGYGGAGQHPPVIVAAPYQGAIYGQPVYQVSRSQPFGYVVDGYGRYPWTQQQGHYQTSHQGHHQGHGCGGCHAHSQPAPQPVYYQSAPVHVSQPPIHVQAPPVYVQGAQVHVTPSPVHVAPPQVEVAAPQIIYDQGYFAVPPAATPPAPPAPPSPTERPYRQEGGERG